jgi:DNA-binding XRE family transcriptional regulator
VVKTARRELGKTQSELALRLEVSKRHIMSIENNRQKPSYDLLFRLIRELSIPADLIFYPEEAHSQSEFDKAVRMLRTCDDKELDAVISLLHSLLKDK